MYRMKTPNEPSMFCISSQLQNIGEEIGRIVAGQKRLESKYGRLSKLRDAMQRQNATREELEKNEASLKEVSAALKQSTQVLSDSPLPRFVSAIHVSLYPRQDASEDP